MHIEVAEPLIFAILVFYKVACLLVGLGFAYMGYRLFLAEKVAPSGDLKVTTGQYSLSLLGAAPGIFFSLFGTVLICLSIFRGAEYESTPHPIASDVKVLPDKPPFDSKK